MSTILVGVDASERSHDAIAFAKQLASASGATVVLANIFPYEDRPSRGSSASYRRILSDDALELVDRLRTDLSDLDPGRVETTVAARTSPAHGLHDLADMHGADLIVVGSSHVSTRGRVMPGSTAERLLHGAGCPVAIVPKGYTPTAHELPQIGVAYNGSDEAKVALRAAVEVARATGATLRVIEVLDAMSYVSPALMGGPSSTVTLQEVEREVQEELDQAVAEVPDDVAAEARFLVGDPAYELAVQTTGLDVLITGSRGYGPAHAVITGGVVGRLLRQAACPVIVLPRGVDMPLERLFAPEEASV